MKKLILILCTSLLLVSCNRKAEDPITPESQPENVVESLYDYDVSNTSKNFSNDDLIYFIMIDRFADGDLTNNNFPDSSDDKENLKSYLGGDLQGVIDQLDYIKSLGATTIWLTPVVKNEPYGYHGYWTEDFYAVDPHFGDMATLQSLVNQAHEKDMKVILDYVVNHTGYQHPWTTDPDKKEWFHNNGDITNFNDVEQVENNNLAGLPDLNTENPSVKAYFFENALWWIRETGVDGMRLDTVRHVPKEFWNEFAYIIKQEYPDFYLLGEVWMNSASFLESYHELGLDALTNYSLYNGIENTFKLYGDANKLRVSLQNESKFSNPELNGVFIDNHDVSRLISRSSKHGDTYLKQSLTFVMTYPAIPIIYYGTEVGMTGKNDPDNRQFMPWESDFESLDIYNYYLKLVELRSQINGYDEIEVIASHSDYIAVKQSRDDQSMIIVYNISDRDHEINLNVSGQFKNYITNESVTLNEDTVFLSPGLSTIILLEE